MRFRILTIAFFLAWFCFVLPAQAANPDHVAQLLKQRVCLRCDLSKANLANADLRGVNLTGSNLQEADLSGAQLWAVTLKDADLTGANLSKTVMLVVNLSGATLNKAKAEDLDLKGATFCHTTLPDGKTSDRDCGA
jgi:uncharacterized protein YjbI with pentapeptide repeats